jgi:hypothetical protein
VGGPRSASFRGAAQTRVSWRRLCNAGSRGASDRKFRSKRSGELLASTISSSSHHDSHGAGSATASTRQVQLVSAVATAVISKRCPPETPSAVRGFPGDGHANGWSSQRGQVEVAGPFGTLTSIRLIRASSRSTVWKTHATAGHHAASPSRRERSGGPLEPARGPVADRVVAGRVGEVPMICRRGGHGPRADAVWNETLQRFGNATE